MKHKVVFLSLFAPMFLGASVLEKLMCKVSLSQRKVISESGIPPVQPVLDIEGPFASEEGPLWIFKKKAPHLTWESHYEPHPAAIQGDPNWIPDILHKGAGHFLGFQKSDENTLTVPGAQRVNAAIDKVNKIIRERNLGPDILMGYYSCSTDRAPLRQYLTEFAENMRLPISEGYASMVHDISYHLAAIFYPSKILLHAQKQTKFLLGFVDHMERQIVKNPDELRLFLEHVMYYKMKELDEGTGNAFLLFRSRYTPLSFLYKSIQQVASFGNSPSSMLLNYLFRFGSERKVSPELKALVYEYLKLNAASNDGRLEKRDMNKLCKEVFSNLRNFENAVEIYNRERPL